MAATERKNNYPGLEDGIEALKLVFKLTWKRNVVAWVYIPIGLCIILLVCFGISSAIAISGVSFPASVAGLLILFFGLVLSEKVLGDKRTRAVVKVIDVPFGFALKWMNIFFTPSFVRLPLSPSIGGIEVAKLIAVFIIGFIVVMVGTAYMTRLLQLILGSSKRAITERAEEMGAESDSIPLSEVQPTHHNLERSQAPSAESSQPESGSSTPSPVNTPGVSTPGISTPGNSTPGLDMSREWTMDLLTPQPTQDPSLIRGTGGPPEASTPLSTIPSNHLTQTPPPLTRPQRWAAFINQNFDRLTYVLIFLFIGLPIYYSTGYAMPAQLTFNILAYFIATSIPPKYKRVLHPVLVSAVITCLGIWALGEIRGNDLTTILDAYKTGTTYLVLWNPSKHNLLPPGAGDILVSVLDCSIVGLGLPMFAYRAELKRHFFTIVIPNVLVSVGSLFGYPWICYVIGISSTRSLALAVRSLTLALAIPACANLGGDASTGAATAIMSGILGALVGSQMLDWMKIPEDDYVTRGVTLGGSSSAIATAVLLVKDPRAAALSSLSMSLFGIITLALTSVPVVVRAIDSIVGL